MTSDPPQPVVQAMEPLSDEDVSDFDEEPDLPSGAGNQNKPPSPTADDEEEESELYAKKMFLLLNFTSTVTKGLWFHYIYT